MTATPTFIQLEELKMQKNILYVTLVIMFLLWNCSSNSTSSDEAEIEGDYLFVEMFIVSYAEQISGNCEPEEPHGHTGIQYEYDPNTRTLNYRAGPLFPVSEQLQMVFAERQFFEPPSLAGGGDRTEVIPVYFIPDQLTRKTYVEGADSGCVSLAAQLRYSFVSVDLPIDSTFHKVFKTVAEGAGIDCIWEYTDSLIIRNYGFNPKKNIVRRFQNYHIINPILIKGGSSHE
jgi:hypothetical protein